MLTRKHFKAIAQVIKTTSTKKQLVNELCIIFKQSNRLFNKARFIEACMK